MTGTRIETLPRVVPGPAGKPVREGAAEGQARARAGARVRGDASRLPLADGCADAVVICDGPLFAAEVVRVLNAGGPLVWSNPLGRGAPFYLPTEVLAEALGVVSGPPVAGGAERGLLGHLGGAPVRLTARLTGAPLDRTPWTGPRAQGRRRCRP